MHKAQVQKRERATNYYFKEMPNDYVEDQRACHEQFFFLYLASFRINSLLSAVLEITKPPPKISEKRNI